MADMKIALNTEAFRHADKSLEYCLEATRRMGYRYVELNLMNGRDLFSEAGYSAAVSMERDPLEIKALLDEHGLKCLGVSAHAPFMRPDVGVPFLRNAIVFADAIGARAVNTDEGIKPAWATERQAFDLMHYTLRTVLEAAERHKVHVAVEPHQVFTVRIKKLLKILALVDSPYLSVNMDTGNVLMSGFDPYTYLETIADRCVHFHAKDITGLFDERGKVTGVPSGCAVGDGEIDWARVVKILRKVKYTGVLAVECGTEEQAAKSIKFLRKALRKK